MHVALPPLPPPPSGLLILLVLEALCVQPICTMFHFLLFRNVEKAHQPHFLIMLGLPGPILRQMVSAHVRVGEGCVGGGM